MSNKHRYLQSLSSDLSANQSFSDAIESTEEKGNQWMYDDTRRYPRSSSSCSGSMEDVGCHGSLNNQKPVSRVKPLRLEPLYCSFLLFFLVVFLFLSLSPFVPPPSPDEVR